MAQALRLAIALGSMAVAGWSWLALSPGWLAWVAAAAIFLAGGMVAELVFRRVASPEAVRADLKDRVRNPPA